MVAWIRQFLCDIDFFQRAIVPLRSVLLGLAIAVTAGQVDLGPLGWWAGPVMALAAGLMRSSDRTPLVDQLAKLSDDDKARLKSILSGCLLLVLVCGVGGCSLVSKPAANNAAGTALCRYVVPEVQRPMIADTLESFGATSTASFYGQMEARLSIVRLVSPQLYGAIWDVIHSVLRQSRITDAGTWQNQAAAVIQQILDGCLSDLTSTAVA
jgi:hypothetical protein